MTQKSVAGLGAFLNGSTMILLGFELSLCFLAQTITANTAVKHINIIYTWLFVAS